MLVLGVYAANKTKAGLGRGDSALGATLFKIQNAKQHCKRL